MLEATARPGQSALKFQAFVADSSCPARQCGDRSARLQLPYLLCFAREPHVPATKSVRHYLIANRRSRTPWRSLRARARRPTKVGGGAPIRNVGATAQRRTQEVSKH